MSLLVAVQKKLNIHVIGAGGTGGYAVTYLARMLAGGEHVIHVYDGDRVEAKNLKRQNFRASDLDLNKAQALCRHVTEDIIHAPEMVAHDKFVGDKEEFLADIVASLEDDQSLILVLAVDNIATRRMVNELLMDDLLRARILTVAIDSGNNDQGGQVVLYANAVSTWTQAFKDPSQGLLPNMLQVYPELNEIEDENPANATNCAENAESAPQAMMCNVRNGELIAHIITRILETCTSPGNLWRSDILTGATVCSFTGFLEGNG